MGDPIFPIHDPGARLRHRRARGTGLFALCPQALLSAQRESFTDTSVLQFNMSFFAAAALRLGVRLKSLSFRTLLIVLSVCQILIAVGTIGYISYSVGQKSVDDVAEQLCAELSNGIRRHLRSYLGTASAINEMNIQMLHHGFINIGDTNRMAHYFWDLGQAHRNYGAMGFADSLGNSIGANIQEDYIFMTRNGIYRRYRPDKDGYPSRRVLVEKQTFDPRKRIWYKQAAEAGRPIMTDIRVSVASPRMNTSLASPYYDGSNKLLGVVNTGMPLSLISDFLRGLEIGRSGKVFIVDSSGLVIASSANEMPFIIADRASLDIRRLSLSQSSDPLLTAAASFLEGIHTNLKEIKEERRFIIDASGRRLFFNIAPYSNNEGINWLIGIVVPEADFTGRISSMNRVAVVLIIFALILSSAGAVMIANWVVKPILELNASARALARGEWEKALTVRRWDEVGELTGAFNSMATQLKQNIGKLTDEVYERTQAEKELRFAKEELEEMNDTLEQRVEDRTKELRKSEEQLRAFALRLAEAEENERKRLSQELHDEVGQQLSVLGINLSLILSQTADELPETVRSRIADSIALVGQTTEMTRNVMANLRPPVLDDYGLSAALKWYADMYSQRTGIAVKIEAEAISPRPSSMIENALFRIAQEALTNVAKHARATRVTVSMRLDGPTLRLEIADDGIGFDPLLQRADNKWGLINIVERADAIGGILRVQASPGSGTRVVVEVGL